MRTQFKLLPVLFLLLVSCSGKNKPNFGDKENTGVGAKEAEIFQIDPRTFEERELTLADFAADIEYVPLSNKIQMGIIRNVKANTQAIYLVSDKTNGGEGNGHQELFRFDKNGKNPVRIGRIGKGPQEYLLGSLFAVDELNDRIYINGKPNYVLVFNTRGQYLREFRFHDPDIKYGEMQVLNDQYLFVPEKRFGANTQYLWTIVDTLGNIVSRKKNYAPRFETRSGPRGGTYSFKDKVSCWVDYNDTIFTISPNLSYQASYVITPGEHRRPKKDLPFSPDLPVRLTEYFSPHYFIETNAYLICRYNYKKKFAYLFLDKATHKAFICDFEWKRDEKSAIPNDFDGGLMFTPDSYFSGDDKEYLAGIIQPFELKQYVASEAFKSSTPKYPEKKNALEKLANSLNENDNPVMMFVKLKE